MHDSALLMEPKRLRVPLWRAAVILVVVAMCKPSRSLAQTASAPNSIGVPKPAVEPTAGTWKYKSTSLMPDSKVRGVLVSTWSVTIQGDAGVWTITTAMSSDDSPVMDVSTFERGTLILRKESFLHFPHQGQPWKPVAINLDFTGNKVTGTMKYVTRPDEPVALELGGPVFAAPGPTVMIGCLPLAPGYSATFRYFEIDRVPIDPPAAEKLMRLKVMGMERVTVPAGTFDSYKVELTSADGRSYKETVWIAKDSHIPVKSNAVEFYGKGSISTATELVP